MSSGMRNGKVSWISSSTFFPTTTSFSRDLLAQRPRRGGEDRSWLIEAVYLLRQDQGGPVMLDVRAATVGDADSVADVYLRSRKELVAGAPLVHSDEDVRDWVRGRLIPAGRTTVAVADGRVIGLLAVSRGTDCSWIDQLYLLPEWVERSIGTRLLEIAQSALPSPIRLYTFQCNERARCFYERRGFQAIAFGDGSGNEEKCPDILYEWT
jgi:GNAT superfamily N-acetyltransferase